MTNLSEREFWLQRRSIVGKPANPLINPAWIIAMAVAVAIIAVATYDFSDMRIRHQASATSHIVVAPSESPKNPLD
jgi:hypothetical protein